MRVLKKSKLQIQHWTGSSRASFTLCMALPNSSASSSVQGMLSRSLGAELWEQPALPLWQRQSRPQLSPSQGCSFGHSQPWSTGRAENPNANYQNKYRSVRTGPVARIQSNSTKTAQEAKSYGHQQTLISHPWSPEMHNYSFPCTSRPGWTALRTF